MNADMFNWPEDDPLPATVPTYLCEFCAHPFSVHRDGSIGNLYCDSFICCCVDYVGERPPKKIMVG